MRGREWLQEDEVMAAEQNSGTPPNFLPRRHAIIISKYLQSIVQFTYISFSVRVSRVIPVRCVVLDPYPPGLVSNHLPLQLVAIVAFFSGPPHSSYSCQPARAQTHESRSWLIRKRRYSLFNTLSTSPSVCSGTGRKQPFAIMPSII